MLALKTYKSLAALACMGALVTPLFPLVGSLTSPPNVAYAAVLPLSNDQPSATAPVAQSYVVPTAATSATSAQTFTAAAAAPMPTPTLDTFWATPQSVLDHRAAVSREKHADAWEKKARAAIIEDAQQYVGKVPYVFGGATPAGWDCSGYTMYVYGETLDVPLEHSVLAQRAAGHIVKKEDAKPGDLVVFSSAEEDGFHVGIYLGGDQMLNAPVPGEMTKVGNVYWDPANTVQFVNVLGLAPDAPKELDHWDAGIPKVSTK